MEPFRSAPPTCARCAAQNPDHYSQSGDLVCRACAALPALDARLAQGKRDGFAGGIVALVFGVVLVLASLYTGISNFSYGRSFENRFNARLMGLGIGLGVMLIVAGVRNTKVYSKSS